MSRLACSLKINDQIYTQKPPINHVLFVHQISLEENKDYTSVVEGVASVSRFGEFGRYLERTRVWAQWAT